MLAKPYRARPRPKKEIDRIMKKIQAVNGPNGLSPQLQANMRECLAGRRTPSDVFAEEPSS